MRSDLDRLMKQQGLDGLVVVALDRYSTAMHYVTGQRIFHGVYLRAADGCAHLIVDPMERDQAAASGVEHSTFPQHGMVKLQQEEPSPARVFGRMTARALEEMGVNGRVAFLGDLAIGAAFDLVQRAREVHPGIAEVDTSHPDLLLGARATKDDVELEATRRASRGTVEAMRRVRDHLAASRIVGDRVEDADGPLKLGKLRRLVRETFMAHGLVEDGDSILAQGRDAGVPHNRGNDDEVVRPGAPIIVDIFPGEAGGGYHSDMTRTFCVGKASPELKRIYADTHDAFRQAMDALKVGRACRDYQEMTCELFEQRGHATGRSTPGTEEGYVHGLGHGVGLSVHEGPRLGGPPSNTAVIEPRQVITVEPGLYYPARGMGVRIEDLVAVRDDGTFENMTPFPYDLEIEPRA